MNLKTTAACSVLLLTLLASPAAAQTPLTVKAGDVWVMSGDSITAQRQHSNYIEAFYRTRYPDWKLQFRNSGIGGNRTESILSRFDYDLAAFKPTIISIELGMNDVGSGDDPTKYIDGMRKLIARVRAVNAVPVLISSSPVNDGSQMNDWKSDRCRRIHLYTEALGRLAQEEKVTVVDQYHTLLELWHDNKQSDGKEKFPLGGDAVHPGPVGQFTMAAVILEALGVDREVSSVALQADGTVVESQHCKIMDAKSADGVLTFTRLDERSPWPVPAKCRPALELLPKISELSQYTLKIVGLPAGDYVVLMNGKEAAKLPAAQLAAGWNMSTLGEGVIAEQGQTITDLIAKLQSPLNSAWRAASKAKDAAKLTEAQMAIDACEAELAAACHPKPIQFEIRAVQK